jgi:pyruvate/2-oxoglutarate dehydrogenase complex dihydrolipoamide acyltransferase (E2) component
VAINAPIAILLTEGEDASAIKAATAAAAPAPAAAAGSPSPQPSPTKGEGDNWDYFLSNTNGFIGFISRFRNEFGMTFKFLLSC